MVVREVEQRVCDVALGPPTCLYLADEILKRRPEHELALQGAAGVAGGYSGRWDVHF
ncbi:hypothetical protein GCM10011335_34790 [Aureimonas glaciei]|uniref:Uncharacterized protein n=1 Tax=Aureimonas glaciei TaxID=1776957 RepID=A0A916Y2I1_9HYPH|nr:hypothetical protein GCM10011335_34790 [Aureimonas glaciei]